MSPVLLFHTVRHLKPVQVYRRLWRPRPRLGLSAAPQRRLPTGTWTAPIEREPATTGPDRFRFLNQERQAPGWNDAGVPKLWLYNLHYFEAPSVDLMRRWVTGNPAGEGVGWEPYPLSLRIGNWTKWALCGGSLPAACVESMAQQAEFLEGAVEYHLLANHLIANAKALIFAGVFFAGRDAERRLAAGLAILGEQLAEQVLRDGGHFERSPMYHSLILEDLLDLVNLARAYPEAALRAHSAAWEQTASAMLCWLQKMCHPDGQIGFFNDAAFGVAPEPRRIFDYAARLGVAASVATLGESGYVRLERHGTTVIFDAAPIGPDYQPGHAHADTLSFELSRHGRRAVVNSGTSTYEAGRERVRQRGTAAHSTVVVDGADQSEVWSSFRVGRRARVTESATDHATYAEAKHDGYRRLADPVVHKRRLEFAPGALVVTDELAGRGRHSVDIYFHLHPDANPAIRLDARLRREERPGTYHPGFNLSVPNRVVVGRYEGQLPMTFVSAVEWD